VGFKCCRVVASTVIVAAPNSRVIAVADDTSGPLVSDLSVPASAAAGATGHATARTATLTVTPGDTPTTTDPNPGGPATSTPDTTDPAVPIDARPDRPQAMLQLAHHQRIATLLARRAIRASCQLRDAGTCRIVATTRQPSRHRSSPARTDRSATVHAGCKHAARDARAGTLARIQVTMGDGVR
jgi:hypothetical protein